LTFLRNFNDKQQQSETAVTRATSSVDFSHWS